MAAYAFDSEEGGARNAIYNNLCEKQQTQLKASDWKLRRIARDKGD